MRLSNWTDQPLLAPTLSIWRGAALPGELIAFSRAGTTTGVISMRLMFMLGSGGFSSKSDLFPLCDTFFVNGRAPQQRHQRGVASGVDVCQRLLVLAD